MSRIVAVHPITAHRKEISEDEVDQYREAGWSVADTSKGQEPVADQSTESKERKEADEEADQTSDDTATSAATAEAAQTQSATQKGPRTTRTSKPRPSEASTGEPQAP